MLFIQSLQTTPVNYYPPNTPWLTPQIVAAPLESLLPQDFSQLSADLGFDLGVDSQVDDMLEVLTSALAQAFGSFTQEEDPCTCPESTSGGTIEQAGERVGNALRDRLQQRNDPSPAPVSDDPLPPPSEYAPTSNLQSQDAWVPLDAPTTSDPSDRSADNYDSVIDQFDVENNPRYAIRDSNGDGVNDTFCNIFVSDVTKAMGAEIPHWWEGRELNANATCDWLQDEGANFGWRPVSESEAQAMANEGKPVVATWKNEGGIGHVGMVRPGEISNGPALAQAGAQNLNDAQVLDIFPAEVIYYAHA